MERLLFHFQPLSNQIKGIVNHLCFLLSAKNRAMKMAKNREDNIYFLS